jgi:hypothetical protein
MDLKFSALGPSVFLVGIAKTRFRQRPAQQHIEITVADGHGFHIMRTYHFCSAKIPKLGK